MTMNNASGIWIIDDDVPYYESLKLYLDDNDLRVTGMFSRGGEAIQRLGNCSTADQPAAIILDVMLPYDDAAAAADPTPPEWSAIRVGRELKNLSYNPEKIIVVTALRDGSHEKLEALGILANNILFKPVRGGELLRAVRRAIKSASHSK